MNKKVLSCLIVLVVIIFLGVFFLVFADKGNGSNKRINLEIDCNGKDLSGEYKKGDSFKCELLGEEFVIEIKKVSGDAALLKVDKYGLSKVTEKGTISLMEKVDEFELKKDKELVLGLQATDVSADIKINWK